MSSNALSPKTGTIRKVYDRAKTEEVVAKLKSFSDVWIDTPYHHQLQSGLDTLRLFGKVSDEVTHRALRCLAPPSTGKSTVARKYRDLINLEAGSQGKNKPVLLVSLSNSMTSKKLITSMLMELGDPHATKGVEQLQGQRLEELVIEWRIELIIIDEVHHLASRRNVTEVINALKSLLNKKICPLAFLGTMDAEKLLTSNGEIGQRIANIADIKPLQKTAGGRATLHRFLSGLDQELQRLGIFRCQSDFTNEQCVDGLLKATNGVMGLSARILQNSLETAVRRNADRIEAYDVSMAIDTWAIPNGFCKTNPLTTR